MSIRVYCSVASVRGSLRGAHPSRVVAACMLAPLLVGLWACGAGADEPTPLESGLEVVSQAKLKMHLQTIASDELEGRATPSAGLDVASRYLASHLEYYGCRPAGDANSYFQKIKVARVKTGKDSRLTVRARGLQADFNIGVDFVGGGSDLSVPLAFAGYGLSAPEKGYDDYAGLDVKDKVVLILDGYPEGREQSDFQIERTFRGRTRRFGPNRSRTAQEKGAAGLVVIQGPAFVEEREQSSTSAFDQAVNRLEQERTVFVFREESAPLNVFLTPDAGKRLERLFGAELGARGGSADAESAALPEATIEARWTREEIETLWPRNVLAFLEGSDPALKEEIVVFSAHYDHIGRRAPRGGSSEGEAVDEINNGADDDGSGTVGILNLAEAFAAMPRTRRSLLFFWTCGEERGLIGSDFYVRHPAKPLEKTVAVFNIDMIGRNYQDKSENADHVFLVGTTQTSDELDSLVGRINEETSKLNLDRSDPANYFRRSDHYNFAKNGIPVAFFCTGEHKDYHRPSDEVEHIQFDKMERILELVLRCGWEVANADERPKVKQAPAGE